MVFGSFPIAERFVSINGEGAHAGKLAAFIRFPGCNLDCSYCDTQWARDPELTVEFVSVEELCDWVEREGVTCVTITGGEPTLQSDLYRLLHALARLETVEVVEIETNGSTDLAKLNKIPDKRSRFLKRMIELPLVGTLLYHTLTGRSNIELLFTESYYHNPFHRSPEDVDAFYESAHLQNSAGKYLLASLVGNYVNLNIGHALKHIDNSMFLIGGEEEPGIAETFALYTALNTSIETQILPKTKHMPQMEAPQALLEQIQIFFAPVQ